MRKLSAFILLLCLCCSAAGQNIVTDFANSIKGRCSTFDYKYSLSGSMPVSGSGTVRLQDSAFTMTGNGLDIKCDGSTRWTVDTVAEECYIEDISGQDTDFETNPALLVGAVDNSFTLKKTSAATFNQRQVTEATLAPKTKGGSISSVSLFFGADKKPAGAVITLKDGTLITVSISSFTTGKSLDMKEFRLNTKTLSQDYVITDLR